MKKIIYIYIFLLSCFQIFADESEVEHYNLEIKNNISSDYSGTLDKKPSSSKKKSTHQKWFAEDFFNSAEDYFQDKEEKYREYKKNLEENLEKSLNSKIVPEYLDSNLDVIVKLDEDTEKIKLKYRYTPNLIKESYVDLGLEEEELKLSYVYEKPVDGLDGYFFNSVAYILDTSVRNILELSKIKVK